MERHGTNRYRVEDVPNVQLIDYTRFVSDPADAINEADEAALNQRIGHLRDSLDVEIAVVVLPAIDGDTLRLRTRVRQRTLQHLGHRQEGD